MDLIKKGKVYQILQEKEVKGKDGMFKIYAFVLDSSEVDANGNTFTNQPMFEVIGDERWAKMDLHEGDIVEVHFDINARESNGRWFNSVRAWKVEH